MAVTRRYVCDLSEMSATGVVATTEDGEEVEVPPAGWLEITVRRVLPNVAGTAAAEQRNAMRQQAIDQAVATQGMTEEQAEAAVDQLFPEIEVPEFIVQDYELHVSAKHATPVLKMFDIEDDDGSHVAPQE